MHLNVRRNHGCIVIRRAAVMEAVSCNCWWLIVDGNRESSPWVGFLAAQLMATDWATMATNPRSCSVAFRGKIAASCPRCDPTRNTLHLNQGSVSCLHEKMFYWLVDLTSGSSLNLIADKHSFLTGWKGNWPISCQSLHVLYWNNGLPAKPIVSWAVSERWHSIILKGSINVPRVSQLHIYM